MDAQTRKLNTEKIKNRITKAATTKESLRGVIPMGFTKTSNVTVKKVNKQNVYIERHHTN